MRKNPLLLVAALLFIGACAGRERHIDNVAFDLSPNQNLDDKMKTLQQELITARSENVHLLSPSWFYSAERSYKDAEEARSAGGEFKTIVMELTEGQAQLERAKQFATQSREKLDDVLRARNDAVRGYQGAQSAGVSSMGEIAEDMREADGYLMDLTERVEDGDVIGDERLTAIRRYNALKVQGVQKAALGEAKRTMELADNEGADSYVPKTFGAATEQLKAAEAFIASNPDSTNEIRAKSKELNGQAARVLTLTREARAFDDRTPEESVLYVESTLNELGDAVATRDLVAAKRFDEQVDLLASSAREVRGTASTAQGTIRDMKAQNVLSAEQLKAIRSKFTSAEADILQQNGKLILRLKGVNFASGESKLGTENMAVLGKVAEALGEVPTAAVVVEGHTDATGSADANAKLSQARAESVMEYLVSSGALTGDRASAVGRGFEKPVASGKSKEGRAKNRRIDLVIGGASTRSVAE